MTLYEDFFGWRECVTWNLTAAKRAVQNARIVIQSRVHTDDWTGYVLATSFDQIKLDMDYDGEKT
jgi:hypothetical protein